MYCKKCGAQHEVEGAFCKYCGEHLQQDTQAGDTYGASAYTNQGYNQRGHVIMERYAGFWKRFVAILIDGVILGIVETLIGFILSKVGLEPLLGLVSLVISWCYFACMESSERQATIGKMALGIKVVSLEGERVSFARATGRYFSKIFSGLIICIGYMMAGFTEKKQALHDKIASTLVVNE